ncbi:MAG: magnesium/cobalt transporter CorA [Lysobacterales bacterium]
MSEYNIVLYEPQSKQTRCGGVDLLDEWDATPDSWIWLNVSGTPDAGEKKLLGERFGLNDLAIQDAQRERHPPKIEVFDTFVFVILRDLVSDEHDEEINVAGVSLLIGTNFLVTRHHHPVPAVGAILDLVRTQPSELASGPDHIFYLISRRIVDNYTPVVLNLEEDLAELEDHVFDEPGDDSIELITRYNRAFKQMRRHLANQRDVVTQLHRPAIPLPVKLNKHEFNDVYEHFERLTSLCHLNQELATDLLNTHLNLVSHRLNNVMRILTIATVLFLPLSLLAGIYGMNFQYMPELGWKYGYFGVLGLMAVVVIVLISVFKRRKWL